MQNIQEQPLMKLKAINGTVFVFDNRVVIKRTGLVAFSNYGLKGDTTFFYNTLSGIEYKKPGWVNGYLRFIVAGTPVNTLDTKSKSSFFAIPQSNMEDPNTVILSAVNSKTVPQSEEVYSFISQKINEMKSNIPTANYIPRSNVTPNPNLGFSGADEIAKYKKLLDCGAITQEEFETAKKQIFAQSQQR